MTVRATSVSTSVNPLERLLGCRIGGYNLSASREPIDPDLKTDGSAPHLDGPSARHSAGKKDDCSAGFAPPAGVGEQGVESTSRGN